MNKLTGMTSLYYGFLKHLKQREVHQRIAPLQLTGKIEDYLTKEFVSYIFSASQGTRFAIVNSGKSSENKIDLALIKSSKNGYVAESFVEAKYLRNRHRLSLKDMDAVDEHSGSIKDLHRQLSYELDDVRHGLHDVKLRSTSTKIYGLIFASYTRPESTKDEESEDRSKSYFKSLLEKASKQGLRYHDMEKPYLREIYEDVTFDVLGRRWLITLRGGLWRI